MRSNQVSGKRIEGQDSRHKRCFFFWCKGDLFCGDYTARLHKDKAKFLSFFSFGFFLRLRTVIFDRLDQLLQPSILVPILGGTFA